MPEARCLRKRTSESRKLVETNSRRSTGNEALDTLAFLHMLEKLKVGARSYIV